MAKKYKRFTFQKKTYKGAAEVKSMVGNLARHSTLHDPTDRLELIFVFFSDAKRKVAYFHDA
jgi:hypothetical protein